MSIPLTPEELQTWLEWAGARLIAMPGNQIGPKQPRATQIEYHQDKFEIITFREPPPLRASAPSSFEIEIVDQILALPNLCEDQNVRYTLHKRLLVSPLRAKYVYSWHEIAQLLKVKPRVVKVWHARGLREVIRKVNPGVAGKIHSFLQT